MRVIEEAAEVDIDPLGVIQLDLSKAFYRVERTHLLALLRPLGPLEAWDFLMQGR